MTGNNQKVRAVFLAALMVLSVFAGTVAFAGTAAAAPETFSDNNVDAGALSAGETAVVQTIDIADSDGDANDVTLTHATVSEETGTDIPSSAISNVEILDNAGTVLGSASDLGTQIDITDTTFTDDTDANTVDLQVRITVSSSTSFEGTLDVTTQASWEEGANTGTVSAADGTDETIDGVPPGITSVETKAGSGSIIVNFNESLDTSTVADTDFTYNDNNGEGASSISGVKSKSGSTVVLNLDSDITSSDVSQDSIDLSANSLKDLAGNQNNVEQTVSFTSVAAPTVEGAIEYDDGAYSGDSGASEVEVAFSEAMDTSTITTSNVNVYVDGSQVSDSSLTLDMGSTGSSAGSTSRLVIDGISSNVGPSSTIRVQFSGDVENESGIALFTSTTNVSVTETSQTIDPTSAATDDGALEGSVYEGEIVAFEVNSEDRNLELNASDGEFIFEGSSGTSSEIYAFDTDGIDASRDYRISSTDGGNFYYDFGIRNLGLSATISDTEIQSDESFDVTAKANRGGQDVEFQIVDDSGDDYDTAVTRTLNGSGGYTYTFDSNTFTDEDTGNYTVEVTDVNSGVTVETSTLTVSEAGEGSAGFGESTITDARGDIVEIPVTIEETDTATVTVGSVDDGFRQNVTIEDNNGDGEVLLEFNTYTATSGVSGKIFGVYNAEDVSSSDQDVVVNVEPADQTVSSLLEPGDYDLEVVTGDDASVSADNVGTLIIEERSTDAINSWTAPSGTSIADLEDVQDAVADESVTESSEIANGDIVVHELSATGLEGALAVQNQANTSADFFALDGSVYNLTVNQTNPGANRDAYGLQLNATNTQVVADADNDTYYVLFDTNDPLAIRDSGTDYTSSAADGSAVTPADDDVLQANFSVYEDTTASGLADSQQTVMTDYELVNAQVSSDADPINVTNAAEQTVTGTATVAPGTELNLRVRSDSDVRPSFLKTATVTVQADGSWSATMDFSDASVGDTFSVTSSGGHDNLIASADQLDVDGNVVESVSDTTTTAEPTTEEPTDEPTEEPTDEPTEEPTEEPTDEPSEGDSDGSGTSTPGFGVVVALTALLAAALLATRRE